MPAWRVVMGKSISWMITPGLLTTRMTRRIPSERKSPMPGGCTTCSATRWTWVTGNDGKPVTCGGSFEDKPEDCTPSSRAHQTDDWNSTDPQNPKSKWWLSDGQFVGFRIICEQE